MLGTLQKQRKLQRYDDLVKHRQAGQALRWQVQSIAAIGFYNLRSHKASP